MYFDLCFSFALLRLPTLLYGNHKELRDGKGNTALQEQFKINYKPGTRVYGKPWFISFLMTRRLPFRT